MVNQHARANSDGSAPSQFESGDFPFPLSEEATESPYLRWLRSRSNYMATRGFLDYLRAVGLLVRGVVVNFLTFVPYLLLVALLLAYSHHWMLANPFLLTFVMLMFAAVWVLIFPITTPFFKIVTYERSVATGSESSFAQRDLYERTFGGLVLAIFAVAALESLPWVLEYVHDRIQLGEFGWHGALATMAASVVVLSGSDKLLSALSGLKKKLAMVLIGILGLLLPLIVILFATDFLVYALPPSFLMMVSPLAVPVVGVIGITIAVPLGLWRRAFTRNELLAVVGLLVMASAVAVAVTTAVYKARTATEASKDTLDQDLAHLNKFASQLESISNPLEVAPEVAALVDDLIAANRNLESEQRTIGQLPEYILGKKLQKFEKLCKVDDQSEVNNQKWFEIVTTFGQLWNCRLYDLAVAEYDERYFSSAPTLAVLAHRLSAQPADNLAPLRGEISRLAHDQALQRIDQALEQIRERTSIDDAPKRLRDTLVEHYLRASPREDGGNDAELAHSVREVSERFKQLVDDHSRVRKLAGAAVREARKALQQTSDVTEIASLIDEKRLYEAVAGKFKDSPEEEANIARLAGKEELAKLLTTEEMLHLVFKEYSRADLEDKEYSRADLADLADFVTRTHRTLFLELSMPPFPDKPDGYPDRGADKYAEETHKSASALAELVKLTPGSEESDGSLALYHATQTVHPRDDHDKSLGGKVPTDEEIASEAGTLLARRALDEFDVDLLKLLSFQLTSPPENKESEEYEKYKKSTDEEFEEIGKDKDKNKRLEAFLADQTRALTVLAADAFPSEKPKANETPIDIVEPYYPYLWPDRDRYLFLLAAKALGHDAKKLAELARLELIDRALDPHSAAQTDKEGIFDEFGRFGFDPKSLSIDELTRIATARARSGELAATDDLVTNAMAAADDLITNAMFGMHGDLGKSGLDVVKKNFTTAVMPPNVIFIALLAVVIWLGCWLTVDINLTSIHGLYRDRLAAAFLIGKDTKEDVRIEDDIDLNDICQYDARSTAPYHLINVALNLQGSKDINVRDRKCDFFIFSKRFIGGPHTGYCRSETMEQVFPQMSVASAMAISAAAASPNMGRATSPLLVAFMTLANIRLGYWTPNPGLLEEKPHQPLWMPGKKGRQGAAKPGFTFEEVFAAELQEIERRWDQAYPDRSRHRDDGQEKNTAPGVDHQLFGIGFSGGGIRSAAINLGISQALSKSGVFDHLDYMSTVSGGGYLGSSISTLMRSREKLRSEIAGTVTIEANDENVVIVKPSESGETPRTYRFAGHAILNVRDGEHIPAGRPLLKPRTAKRQSDIAGTVTVDSTSANGPIVSVDGVDGRREYQFSRFDSAAVKTGDTVKVGQDLIRRYDTLGARFRWRVRPVAFLREMLSKLDETHRWVNVSDGGHIENLATIELLRRRCKYIIIGDGEADPNLHFAGLATLIRCARIDLGIHIDIDLDPLRLRKSAEGDDEAAMSGAHWALGTITYPRKDTAGQPEIGYLLYLKSSFTGDEDETIREYRHRNPTFPHQTTADQAFEEDQFEAYRALGQHIAEGALQVSNGALPANKMSFSDVAGWFADLEKHAASVSDAQQVPMETKS